MKKSRLLVVTALTLLLAACGGSSGDAEPSPTLTATVPPTATATAEPTPSPTVAIPATTPSDAITLPPGFSAYVVAENLDQPTSITLAPDGQIYIAQMNAGVVRLVDEDGDGVFEQRAPFTPAFAETLGIAFAPDGTLYIASRGRISTAADTNGDTTADATETIISGLPNDRHQANGLAFGPDGKLYITNGSTCDECTEADQFSATVLQANPDGSELRIYASGLRNPYDIAFDADGRLWATDNGSDGGDAPFCASIDELDLIEDGNDYGWPYGAVCDPQSQGTPPLASLGLHTGSTGVTAYRGGNFPPEFAGDLFLTLWGSFGFSSTLERGLYRAAVDDSGATLAVAVEQFATGFVRPIDVIADRDGSLLVIDFGNGAVYRIIYTGF